MSQEIDLDYRPETYFGAQRLERRLLAQVKGAVLRKKLESLFEAGRHAEVIDLLASKGISAADRKVLESFHPRFMGGNYLPDRDEGEVEVASIQIRSTTYDVTTVYARPGDGCIHYRVVDEYDGDTLNEPTTAQTERPMSLREFADFFLTAWPLIDVLWMNFENDLESSLDFFSASSDFYREFDRLCRLRVIEAFPDPEEEGDEED